MYPTCDLAEDARGRGPTAPAVRTYRQISAILARREGRPPICPARVRQLCLAAERKLARALLRDPAFREWVSPSTVGPRVRLAMMDVRDGPPGHPPAWRRRVERLNRAPANSR
jgi:hypothetical protein